MHPRHLSRSPTTSRRERRERDHGFSALEAVLVIPTVVIMTMLVVQYVLLWHARNIAQAAAQNGLRTARGYHATAAQGQASAAEYLREVAGPMLTHTSIATRRGPTTVVVTVHATVTSVLPFGSFAVTGTAAGPVEKFAGVAPGFANSDASSSGN